MTFDTGDECCDAGDFGGTGSGTTRGIDTIEPEFDEFNELNSFGVDDADLDADEAKFESICPCLRSKCRSKFTFRIILPHNLHPMCERSK